MDSEIDDGHGYVSSMRVTLRWARKWGGWLIASGILAIVAAAILERADLTTAGITLASLGAGMPSILGGAKAVQARAEAQVAVKAIPGVEKGAP
ncbi:MAG TPA: hypothetical protein PLB91_06895 [Spirochaetales bacterium]|nr:hypothetical protein [Spirochaetales bacterium]HRY52989.1 hypothetical protein [Spirochaetia bacterium]